MRRELGKVPTKVNKDMVAKGSVKTTEQIKTEGSKTPSKWVSERLKQQDAQKKLDNRLKEILKTHKPAAPDISKKISPPSKTTNHEPDKDR